jgi:hypothetical protein
MTCPWRYQNTRGEEDGVSEVCWLGGVVGFEAGLALFLDSMAAYRDGTLSNYPVQATLRLSKSYR